MTRMENASEYRKAITAPDAVPADNAYRDYYLPIAQRLATPGNLEAAKAIQKNFDIGGFVYRDSEGLLLFRIHPDAAIRAGAEGLALPDPGLFPELKQGEGVGLGLLEAIAGIALGKA